MQPAQSVRHIVVCRVEENNIDSLDHELIQMGVVESKSIKFH